MSAFAHLKVAALSDVGKKRKNNEDAFGAFPESGVFCVADGMGGGDDGEIASAAVVRAVEEAATRLLPPEAGGYSASDVGAALSHGLSKASAWICNRAHERKLNGCGSTFVGVVFDATEPSQALAVHAGDSRLYLLRGRSISQVTRDHSVAELMGEKDESKVNPMFRSMVVNGIGIRPKADPEFTPFKVAPGDRVLLCSDGLSRMVPDKKILAVSRAEKDPSETVKALIGAALDGGGVDNVTAVLIEVGKLPPPLAKLELPTEPVTESDAETADEAATVDETSGNTGETQTCATMLTGISEEASFGGDQADESSPEPADDAVPVKTARRGGRRLVWLLLGVLFAVAVTFLVIWLTASQPKPETRCDVVADAETRMTETTSRTAAVTAPVAQASAPAAPVAAADPVRLPTAAPVSRVAAPVQPKPLSRKVSTKEPESVSRPDPVVDALATACEEKSAKAFVRALKRLGPKDEQLLDFDAEVERFLKSARQLARMRGARDAEAAAVDLRVLLLNAESVHSTLVRRRSEPCVAAALKAWDDVLANDPSQTASQTSCVQLMKSISKISTR